MNAIQEKSCHQADREYEKQMKQMEELRILEREAIKFVDSLQHELPKREAPSSEQILKDEEELSTLQSIGN